MAVLGVWNCIYILPPPLSPIPYSLVSCGGQYAVLRNLRIIVIPAQAGIHRNFATTKFVSGGDFLDSGFRRNDGLVGTSLYLFRGSLTLCINLINAACHILADR